MKVEEILQLVKAGFTKDEIVQLASASQKDPEQKNEEPEQKTTEPEKAPEKAPKQPQEDAIKKLSDEIAEVKKKVFEYNVKHQAVDDPKEESSVDILAKLVNPNYGGN